MLCSSRATLPARWALLGCPLLGGGWRHGLIELLEQALGGALHVGPEGLVDRPREIPAGDSALASSSPIGA
jgi:hypothetical protein